MGKGSRTRDTMFAGWASKNISAEGLSKDELAAVENVLREERFVARAVPAVFWGLVFCGTMRLQLLTPIFREASRVGFVGLTLCVAYLFGRYERRGVVAPLSFLFLGCLLAFFFLEPRQGYAFLAAGVGCLILGEISALSLDDQISSRIEAASRARLGALDYECRKNHEAEGQKAEELGHVDEEL